MKSLEWLWEQCPLMVQKIQSLYLFLPLKNNKTVINVNIFKKALIKNLGIYSFWSEKWEKRKKKKGTPESVWRQPIVFSQLYTCHNLCHWKNKEGIKNWVNFSSFGILGEETMEPEPSLFK